MTKKKKLIESEEFPDFNASIDNMPADSKIFVDKSLEIAHHIFRLMEAKGMKQKELAEKMGKSEAEISKILGGMQNLTLRTFSKLEAALEETIICTPKHAELAFPKLDKLMLSLSGMKAKSQKPVQANLIYECKVVPMYSTKDKQTASGS